VSLKDVQDRKIVRKVESSDQHVTERGNFASLDDAFVFEVLFDVLGKDIYLGPDDVGYRKPDPKSQDVAGEITKNRVRALENIGMVFFDDPTLQAKFEAAVIAVQEGTYAHLETLNQKVAEQRQQSENAFREKHNIPTLDTLPTVSLGKEMQSAQQQRIADSVNMQVVELLTAKDHKKHKWRTEQVRLTRC
jgi:uncharacterized coiled-coil protein SlyX